MVHDIWEGFENNEKEVETEIYFTITYYLTLFKMNEFTGVWGIHFSVCPPPPERKKLLKGDVKRGGMAYLFPNW